MGDPEKYDLTMHAAKALASNGYETRLGAVYQVLVRLSEDEIRLLFELAARAAEKDGPEGFTLPEESGE